MKRATPTTCPSGEHVIEFPLNIKREIILNEDGIGTDAFFPLEYLEKLSNFANIAKCYKLCKINNIHLCIDIASLEGIIIERRFPLIKTGWINRPGIDMTDEINKWDQLNKLRSVIYKNKANRLKIPLAYVLIVISTLN